MPLQTFTKTFSWVSDLEGWTTNGSGNTILEWDGSQSATGNSPDGSLHAYANVTMPGDETPYFEYSGTWESLGIPKGQAIISVRLNDGYDMVDSYATGVLAGPYAIYKDGVLQATLNAGRDAGNTEFSWTEIIAQPDQNIPSAIAASDTTVQIRIYATFPSGSVPSVRFDETQLVITYQPRENPWPGRKFQAHPITPILNHNNPLTRGLVLDCLYSEGAGPTRNTVDGRFSTYIPGGTPSLKWNPHGIFGSCRESTVLLGTDCDSFQHPSYNPLACSIEVWFMVRSFPDYWPYISTLIDSENNGIGLRLGDSGVPNNQLEVMGTGINGNVLFQTIFSPYEYYHVVLVTNLGSEIYCYVNGKLDSAFTGQTLVDSPSTNTRLFNDGLGGRMPDGFIYIARRWNRPLKGSEVGDLYRNPFGMYYAPPPPVVYNAFASGTGTANNVNLSITHTTISANATFASPNRAATASLSVHHPTLSAPASFVIPKYQGTFSHPVSHPTILANSTSVVPAYSGSFARTTTHSTISATATAPIPVFHGNASVIINHPIIAASNQEYLIFTGNSTLTVNHPLIQSSAFAPVYHGNANIVINHPTCVVNTSIGPQSSIITQGWGYNQRILTGGYYLGPVYTATIPLTVNHAILTVNGSYIAPSTNYFATTSLVARKTIIVSTASFIPSKHYYGVANLIKHPLIQSSASSVDVIQIDMRIRTQTRMTKTINNRSINKVVYLYGGGACQLNPSF